MSDESQVGKVGWIDITVDDADGSILLSRMSMPV